MSFKEHGPPPVAATESTSGSDRRASIADLEGSLLLAGPARPAVGFRAEAIVLNDSATGMVGRSVWTDEHGDQVYSELRGEGTATGNRIVGTFIGGTGRYSGATGNYEFSWRFVLESEDGTVQGQSIGLQGPSAGRRAARHARRGRTAAMISPALAVRRARSLRAGDRHLVYAGSRRAHAAGVAPVRHIRLGNRIGAGRPSRC